MATNYEYFYKEMAVTPNRTNGLYILRTAASNIKLVNFMSASEGGEKKKIVNTNYYGVNGSFFNLSTDQSIQNISRQDGVPVGPGNLDEINYTGKNAIGWTGTILTAYNGITAASQVGSLFTSVGSWLQGGIGMYLGSSDWEELTCDEMRDSNGVFSDADEDIIFGANARTAMVAHVRDKVVDLIVSEKACSVSEFRSMIQTHLGISDTMYENYNYRGILLDGGHSSQMVVEGYDGDVIEAPQALGLNLLIRAVPNAVVLVDKS